MRIKFTFILLLSLLISGAIFANEINIETARIVAKNCYFEQTGIKQAEAIISEELSIFENQQVVYFVFNFKSEGFVIVAADDEVRPIIGYSDKFTFKVDGQPENLKSWMKRYSQEILYVRENEVKSSTVAEDEWNKYNIDFSQFIAESQSKAVEPLTESITWNQDGGWNAACPEDEAGPTGHAYAGCVATAMSIIMKYWNFPIKGNSSNSYYCPPYGTLSANFGNTTYFWSYMSDTQPNEYSALLMYHCGVAVEMGYSADGSGAFSWDVPSALSTYFNYTLPTYRSRSSYTATTWQNNLKTDLNASRPVYYSGRDADNAGHAFVCDGYNEAVANDYFHINYGWGGYNNGYYHLELASGNESFEFYYDQACITGIYPSETYPDAPQNYTAEQDTTEKYNFKIDLNWDAPANATGLTGYDIYRDDIKINTVSSSETSYTDISSTTGFEAFYGVCAKYDTEQSQFVSGWIDGLYSITLKILIPGTNTGIHLASVEFNNDTVQASFGMAYFSKVPFGRDYYYKVTHASYPTTTGIIECIYKDATIKIYMDGSIVGTEDIISDNTITLYPNPSKGIYFINSDKEIQNISVYNISGQSILNIENSNYFDISDFSNGIYIVKLKTPDGTSIQSVIKE